MTDSLSLYQAHNNSILILCNEQIVKEIKTQKRLKMNAFFLIRSPLFRIVKEPTALLSLFTNDWCTSKHEHAIISKFPDDTTIDGMIQKSDETAYLDGV